MSFFFQAEDGIRDLTVTGVQTCALPIYFQPVESAQSPGDLVDDAAHRRHVRFRVIDHPLRQRLAVDEFGDHIKIITRSEERRVGKECRSRWSPYPDKQEDEDD